MIGWFLLREIEAGKPWLKSLGDSPVPSVSTLGDPGTGSSVMLMLVLRLWLPDDCTSGSASTRGSSFESGWLVKFPVVAKRKIQGNVLLLLGEWTPV